MENNPFGTLGVLALGIVVFAIIAVVGIMVLGGLGTAVSACPSGFTYNTSTSSVTNACYGCTSPYVYDSVADDCVDSKTHSWALAFGVNETVSATGIDAGSDVLTCGGVLLASGVDYNVYNAAGKILIPDNAATTTGANFTSLFDTNVTLTPFGFIDSLLVYTCANTSEVWDSTGNYTLTNNHALLNVLSTGGMANNTVYCYNATGSLTYSGASCTVDFTNTSTTEYSNAPAASQTATYMQNQLTNSSGGIASYTPALIAVAIGAIFIGLLAGFMNARRRNY